MENQEIKEELKKIRQSIETGKEIQLGAICHKLWLLERRLKTK